ncbi:MAG: GNAT family N-acetyltransferase [Nitrospirae bacterium]|nr:GNAT family N-acetyltransferase [Nitrospirota bacterium]NTW66409.1 GNAT family N-acetyltransferase [Nitrospirota bacterium]
MQDQPIVTFRNVVVSDIPIIQDLSSRIWREHYPGIITHAQIDYMLGTMYASGVIHDEILSKGYRYVAVMMGKEAVGYFAYRFEDPDRSVMISKLYLLPSLHGKGIGSRMLAYVKEDALRMGAKSLYLFVNKNNTKAVRSYERFGFVKARAVVTDIGGGFVMDDYRMELSLRDK